MAKSNFIFSGLFNYYIMFGFKRVSDLLHSIGSELKNIRAAANQLFQSKEIHEDVYSAVISIIDNMMSAITNKKLSRFYLY